VVYRGDREGEYYGCIPESDYDEEEEEEEAEEPFFAGVIGGLSIGQAYFPPQFHWKMCVLFSLSAPTYNNETHTQHSSSPVHKARDFECPLCPKRFKTSSSIALHIESGACHNFSRAQVTTAVHALAIVPTISISRRIEGWTPHVVTSYVTERAFNGTDYECYLCHRTFRTLNTLNSHIGSPAHDANEFKCPKCKRECKLISSLMQHIESEVCGIAKFDSVGDFARDLTD